MEEQENRALIPVDSKELTVPKTKVNKITSALKYAGLTVASFGAMMAISNISTLLAMPLVIAVSYSAVKFGSSITHNRHKDLMLTTKRTSRNTTRINQDGTRVDIAMQMRGFSAEEIKAFIELQAIMGISRLDRLNKSGEQEKYTTTTHGFLIGTIEKLRDLGYIDGYSKKEKRSSHLVIEKLAVGNIKGLRKKSRLYGLEFNLTNNKINIDDEKLQETFPEIFGENGIIKKYGFEVITNEDGEITYRDNKEARMAVLGNNQKGEEKQTKKCDKKSMREELRVELRVGVPTLAEQGNNAKEFGKKVPSAGQTEVEEKTPDK